MSAGVSEDRVVCIPLPTPFAIGTVNAFLIKTDPPMLVDTGARVDGAYECLVQALAEHGLKLSDIRTILITHGHLDHMGLLARLLEETGAEAYAHPHAVKRSVRFEECNRENHAFYLEAMREFGVPEEVRLAFAALPDELGALGQRAAIDHAVADGEKVGPLTVHHVPGHSPSDVLFVDHEARAAFTGDHVLRGINPNPLIRPSVDGGPRPRSLVEYFASVRRTRELDLAICYPGHGDLIRDHREVIDALLSRLGDRSARVLSILEDGPKTPHEICKALFPSLDVRQLILGLSVAVGHLEVLEDDGLARAESDAGVVSYRTRT